MVPITGKSHLCMNEDQDKLQKVIKLIENVITESEEVPAKQVSSIEEERSETPVEVGDDSQDVIDAFGRMGKGGNGKGGPKGGCHNCGGPHYRNQCPSLSYAKGGKGSKAGGKRIQRRLISMRRSTLQK